MRKLPYSNQSFDRIVCLWNSFNHLLVKREQIQALKECVRILRPDGKAFFEVMNGNLPMHSEVRKKPVPILVTEVRGVKLILYLHTRKTLSDICNKAGITSYRFRVQKIDRQSKLLLEIKKSKKN